jgi:hypothetical protein
LAIRLLNKGSVAVATGNNVNKSVIITNNQPVALFTPHIKRKKSKK